MKTKRASTHEILSPYSKAVYERNAELYKVLANPKRLEILNIIRTRECSVDSLIKTLGLRKANVSQHLTLLRQSRMVRTRRAGQSIYYKIADPRIVEPCRVLRDLWRNNKTI